MYGGILMLHHSHKFCIKFKDTGEYLRLESDGKIDRTNDPSKAKVFGRLIHLEQLAKSLNLQSVDICQLSYNTEYLFSIPSIYYYDVGA